MTVTTTPRSVYAVPFTTDPVGESIDRDRVIATVTELCLATDRKDWPAVERCFADRVRFDMSSVGGPAATMSPRDISAGWATGLAGVEQLHHQLGNFEVAVRAGHATAFCYGIAYHYRRRRDGRNTRVFVGSYDFELEKESDGWRISAMRFNLKFLDGNDALEAPE